MAEFPRSPVETSTKSSQRHSDGNRRNTVTQKFPENGNWRELYRVAIREPDSAKLPDRIAEAKRVLVQRARELFQKTGDNLEEEQAVDAAMCTLHVLHSTLRAPLIATQTRNFDYLKVAWAGFVAVCPTLKVNKEGIQCTQILTRSHPGTKQIRDAIERRNQLMQ